VEAAIDAGATTINIPDTVGYAIPLEFGHLIAGLFERVPNIRDAVISVHCHNDLGLAVSNSLAAVQNGVRAIECTVGERRPEVAIFGDLYSRDNDTLNQDLVRFIEAHGGEVITTPYTSYVKMVVRPYYWKWFMEGKYMNMLSTGALLAAVSVHLVRDEGEREAHGHPEVACDAHRGECGTVIGRGEEAQPASGASVVPWTPRRAGRRWRRANGESPAGPPEAGDARTG